MFAINERSPDKFFTKCIEALQSDNPQMHAKVRTSLKTLSDYQDSKKIICAVKALTLRDPCSAIVKNYALYQLGIKAKEEIFPFSIDSKRAGIICDKEYRCDKKIRRVCTPQPEAQAGFVVTLPMLFKVPYQTKPSYNIVNEITRQFEEESFGAAPAKSKKEAHTNLRLVIGGNRFKSLDKRVNQAFKKYVAAMPLTVINRARLFGFFWEPIWTKTGTTTYSVKEVRPYYDYLRRLSPKLAERILQRLECPTEGINSRIPYQGIREKIKNHSYTVLAFDSLYRTCPDRPLYMSVMDPDFVTLRINGKGLFSYYQRLIEKHPIPLEYATTGYAASDEEDPLPYWAIRMDMKVRAAIAKVFPQAPYPPEPNLIVLKPEDEETVPESFYLYTPKTRVRSLKKNQTNGNEGRNLLDNILIDREISLDAMACVSKGSLPIAIPPRFVTENTKKITQLSKKNIYRPEILKAFRGIRQAHYRPLWGFAMNVSHALSTSNETIRSYLTKILKPFDPICLCTEGKTTFTDKERFTQLINSYEIQSKVMMDIVNLYRSQRRLDPQFMESRRVLKIIKEGVEQIIDDLNLWKSSKKVYETLLKMRATNLIEDIAELKEQGLEEEEVYKCVEAAAACGAAMVEVLSEIYSTN